MTYEIENYIIGFFLAMKTKNMRVVAVPKVKPIPKMVATEKTLVSNSIPLEKSKNRVTIRQFPRRAFKASKSVRPKP